MELKTKVRCPLCEEELGTMTIQIATVIQHSQGAVHAWVSSSAEGFYGVEHDCPAVAR
jgi:hypothetical protein